MSSDDRPIPIIIDTDIGEDIDDLHDLFMERALGEPIAKKEA